LEQIEDGHTRACGVTHVALETAQLLRDTLLYEPWKLNATSGITAARTEYCNVTALNNAGRLMRTYDPDWSIILRLPIYT